MKSSGKTRKTPRRGWRGLVFRLLAVMLGLAPFAVAELVFVLLDVGRPTRRDDPFVGFSAVHPLFVASEDGTRRQIAEFRQPFFRPDSFAAAKAANEYRIFCLGGSTVQGRPFAIETSFTTWLEINLQSADPGRTWEVVNCGGISYATYRLMPILEEVLAYEPDLIIVYTGHNEFLEDREYAPIRELPRFVARPCAVVARTRTYNLLREGYLWLKGPPERPVLATETDAILDYRGGLSEYHRDEQWRRGVIEHFRYNLRRMVRLTREAGVAMLLVNPVSNLRDCGPFKAQHRDGLSDEQLRQWDALYAEAGRQLGTDNFRALQLLREASAIDDQHADLHFMLGKCFDAVGRTEPAREAYLRAKELDVCPLRMLEEMHEALLALARETDTPLIDVRRLVERRSKGGIPGGYLLIDHVHPSIAGHRLIADAIADEMIRRGTLRAAPGWRQRRDRKADEHMKSLGDMYFARGEERLRAVRGWARGKADAVRR